jgi:hypothetical protein
MTGIYFGPMRQAGKMSVKSLDAVAVYTRYRELPYWRILARTSFEAESGRNSRMIAASVRRLPLQLANL